MRTSKITSRLGIPNKIKTASMIPPMVSGLVPKLLCLTTNSTILVIQPVPN